MPGIDVSTYQGRIDWAAVASTPVRFVIMRSTLGNRYVDTRFRRNLAGATANGLVVGSYHFAKPGRAGWDARAEADHFLRVARNAPGDVLPALDIEDSGGLTPSQLRAWARAWLDRVQERTGLRAMIYSGNSFWRRYMGNTAWFGRRGHPQWIAHWYARSPDLPGRRWAGRGWTFWQWSASGNIRGIRGEVDRDWFRGRDLRYGTIASLTVTPPEGGRITGARIVCGRRQTPCTRLADPGSELTLTARPDDGAAFLRWTGACANAETFPTCTVMALGDQTVSAIFAYPATVALVGAEGETWVASAASERSIAAILASSHACATEGHLDCTIAMLLRAALTRS